MKEKAAILPLLRCGIFATVLGLFSSQAGAQELTKVTGVTVEYQSSFDGDTKHFIMLQEDGTYTVGTQSRDHRRKIETWKSANKTLTANQLHPLIAFGNSPKTRQEFARPEPDLIVLDGDSLLVTITQNQYSVQFHTDSSPPTASGQELVAIVKDLLRQANLHLYERPIWPDVLIGQGNIDSVGLSELFTALRRLHDTQGQVVPVKLYLLGKPDFDTKRAFQILVERRRVIQVLQDIAASLGVEIRIYRDFAVLGTSAELQRFNAAAARQEPRFIKPTDDSIAAMEMIAARLDQVTDFVNRKMEDQRRYLRLDCLSHSDHLVFCMGNEIPVEDLMAVIAADLAEPVAKVFTEREY